jgi:hypothetical protein
MTLNHVVKVFVVDSEGKPLLPTHPARARKLLKNCSAVVLTVTPFTIQLKKVVLKPVGDLTIGVDDGAKEVGLAVVNEHTQEVVFSGTIKLRQDVKKKLTQRRSYRRARRNRKLRYRKAHFYRKKGKGWLSPTIRQKKESILRVVKDLRRLMNITAVVVEQGQFDTQELARGKKLMGVEYQLPDYEGKTFRAKVLWRDKYTCQHCGCHENLQAHHIRHKAHGGTNSPQNGICLCETCHLQLHDGKWVLTVKPKTFEYPAHLQTGKWFLYEQLQALGFRAQRCFGWMTSHWRQQLGLSKTHVNDAIAMVCRNWKAKINCREYLIIPKRKQIWEDNPTKTCVEKNGFQHWDLVKAKHRTKGIVIGSVRSLAASSLKLRTSFDDNFPVSYGKSTLLWRFRNIVYI